MVTSRFRSLYRLAAATSVLAVAGCGAATPPTPLPSLPSDAVLFTAKSTRFVAAEEHVPAGTPWTLALDNQDGLPHNVVITGPAGTTVFASTLVVGPALKTEPAPALAAGNYRFSCAVHPEMQGTISAP